MLCYTNTSFTNNLISKRAWAPITSNRNQYQLLKRTQSDLSHVRPFPTNIYYFKESETKNSKRATPGCSSNRSRGYDFGSKATENTKNVADNDMVRARCRIEFRGCIRSECSSIYKLTMEPSCCIAFDHR